jgi:hypothetical protein
MKVTGAEFREWFEGHFPDGFYMDGSSDGPELHTDSGEWLIAPDELVDPDDYGGLFWDGRDCAPGTPDPTKGEGMNFSTAIKRWRKTRDFDVITLRVPKARVSEVTDAIRVMGIEIAKVAT